MTSVIRIVRAIVTAKAPSFGSWHLGRSTAGTFQLSHDVADRICKNLLGRYKFRGRRLDSLQKEQLDNKHIELSGFGT